MFSVKARGIEFDKKFNDIGIKIRDKLGLECELIQGDFYEHDWSSYDIIFINPDQGFEKGVEDKLLKEMKDDAILLVYNEIFQPRFLKKGKEYWFEGIPVVEYTKI